MKITKAEYDALPEMMKGLYKAEGDGYVATFKTAEEHEEEVSGLKTQNAALIGEKKDAKKKAEEAEQRAYERIANTADNVGNMAHSKVALMRAMTRRKIKSMTSTNTK